MKILVVMVLLVTGMVVQTDAGHPHRFSSQFGHCFVPQHYSHSYKAPIHHAKAIHHDANIKVINNIVGVPVPVPYDKPLAEQGNTVYGYTSVKDLVDPTDYSLYLSQANRLIESAGKLQSSAHANVTAFASQGLENQSNVAEILAAAQAIREIRSSNSASVNKSSVSINLNAGVGESEQPEEGSEPAPQGVGGDDLQLLEQVVTQSCVECHNAQSAKGGYDLTKLFSYDATKLQKVVDAVSEGRMPLDESGNASPLSPEKKYLFLNYAYGN